MSCPNRPAKAEGFFPLLYDGDWDDAVPARRRRVICRTREYGRSVSFKNEMAFDLLSARIDARTESTDDLFRNDANPNAVRGRFAAILYAPIHIVLPQASSRNFAECPIAQIFHAS